MSRAAPAEPPPAAHTRRPALPPTRTPSPPARRAPRAAPQPPPPRARRHPAPRHPRPGARSGSERGVSSVSWFWRCKRSTSCYQSLSVPRTPKTTNPKRDAAAQPRPSAPPPPQTPSLATQPPARSICCSARPQLWSPRPAPPPPLAGHLAAILAGPDLIQEALPPGGLFPDVLKEGRRLHLIQGQPLRMVRARQPLRQLVQLHGSCRHVVPRRGRHAVVAKAAAAVDGAAAAAEEALLPLGALKGRVGRQDLAGWLVAGMAVGES
jgi:hypothetical protein